MDEAPRIFFVASLTSAPPKTTGTVGFLACLLFVHVIYGSVKID
jgi:hypothetical protein